MRRVVADTNILVSAVQLGGKPKFDRAPEWLAETDRQLRVIARIVVPTESIRAIEADPTDDRILECAVAAGAEVIVSGDTHLLSLGSFRGIPSNVSPSSSAAFRNSADPEAYRSCNSSWTWPLTSPG